MVNKYYKKIGNVYFSFDYYYPVFFTASMKGSEKENNEKHCYLKIQYI